MASFLARQSKQFIFFLFVVCVLFQFPSCLVLTGPLLSSLPSTQSSQSHIGTTHRCFSSHGFQARLCLVLCEESSSLIVDTAGVWVASMRVFTGTKPGTAWVLATTSPATFTSLTSTRSVSPGRTTRRQECKPQPGPRNSDNYIRIVCIGSSAPPDVQLSPSWKYTIMLQFIFLYFSTWKQRQFFL